MSNADDAPARPAAEWFVFFDRRSGAIRKVRRCLAEHARDDVPDDLGMMAAGAEFAPPARWRDHHVEMRDGGPAIVPGPAGETVSDAERRARALAGLDRTMRAKRDGNGGVNADIHAAKLAEARLILAGIAIAAPLLEAEAAARALPLIRVAGEVIARADAAGRAVAALEVERQASQAAIRARAAEKARA